MPLPFTSNVVLMRLSYSGFANAAIWKASPTRRRFMSRTSPRAAYVSDCRPALPGPDVIANSAAVPPRIVPPAIVDSASVAVPSTAVVRPTDPLT